MRNKKLILSAVLLSALGLTGLQAQVSINASGGNFSGSGGSVAYSVGQVAYTTNTSVSNGSVSQGVQQPYEISVITAIEEAKGINLTVSAYPNPTTDYLTLSVADFDAAKLSYQLYDMNGKLLETKNIEGNQTSIFMGNLLPAVYFIKVTAVTVHAQPYKEIKTFKIIKN